MKHRMNRGWICAGILGLSGVMLSWNAWAAPPTPPKPASPIINGTAATEADFPMTGGVIHELVFQQLVDPLQVLICSSTLIAPDTVLMAAHCIDQKTLEAAAGEPVTISKVFWSPKADLSLYTNWVPAGQTPSGASTGLYWEIHSGYDINNFTSGLAKNDDLALVFLDKPVMTIPHAYLPTKAEAAKYIVEQAPVWVVGWGMQSSNPDTAIIGEKRKGLSMLSQLGDFEIKVGEAISDVRQCHGDSGGPVFLPLGTSTNASMRLVGVASHVFDDINDCQLTGAVNTRVDAYLDWIDETMKKGCQSGKRVWCDVPGIVPPPGMAGSGGTTGTAGMAGSGGAGAGLGGQAGSAQTAGNTGFSGMTGLGGQAGQSSQAGNSGASATGTGGAPGQAGQASLPEGKPSALPHLNPTPIVEDREGCGCTTVGLMRTSQLSSVWLLAGLFGIVRNRRKARRERVRFSQ
jgi:hypothetical protein